MEMTDCELAIKYAKMSVYQEVLIFLEQISCSGDTQYNIALDDFKGYINSSLSML